MNATRAARTPIVRTLGGLAAALACAGCGTHMTTGKGNSSSTSGSNGPPLVANTGQTEHYAGKVIPADAPSPDFVLRDELGRATHVAARHDGIVLLAFLYTHCTDICPIVAGQLDAAVRSLGSKSRSVRIYAVSVDPEGDTPSAVRAYLRARHLSPQFHWLLGSAAQLKPVWQAFNVLVERRNILRVSHAAPVFVFGHDGRTRLFYPPPLKERDVASDLRLLANS